MTNYNVDEKILVGVVLGGQYDGETKLFYNDNDWTAEFIATTINQAIKQGYELIKIGKHDIPVNKVWAVHNWESKNINDWIIINPENSIPFISPESMSKIDDTKLFRTLSNLIDMTYQSIAMSEDGSKWIELIDIGIDETKQRLLDYRYDKICITNILNSFVNHYNLNQLFEDYIKDLKSMQQNKDDEYEIAKEMYGDLEKFMKFEYWEYK